MITDTAQPVAQNPALRWYDYLSVNIYYLGLTTLSQTFTPLILPLLVQQFIGQEAQGSFFGTLRLWSLMVALLVQSLMGMLSDHSRSRFGRRRPFILIGAILNSAVILLIGLTTALEGEAGFWILFSLVLLMMVAANTAHGAQQGLIPDIIPDAQRGRASGIKAILEVPVPLILVALVIGPMIARGDLWVALWIVVAVIIGSAVLAMLAPEKPLGGPVMPLDWTSFIRLLVMTAAFTLVILGIGFLVRQIEFFFGTGLSLDSAMWMFGIVGTLAMSAAIAIGVLISVRFSLGVDAYRQNPSFAWWVVNRLAYLVGSTNLATFAVFYFQGRLGFTAADAARPASTMLLIVGVFILVTAFPAGWLADRFGHKLLVYLSGVVATLGVLIIVLTTNITIVYVGAILVGLATGLFYTANWALGTELVPKAEAGKYLGISNLAGAGAGAVGAYIGGPIADFFTVNFPNTPGIGYVLLFIMCGLMFLLSVFALMRVKTPNLS